MATTSDLAAQMEPVARLLLGNPNKRLSSKKELRWGKNGSLSVDLEKGTWFDHEAKAGGGVVDLIARETGEAGSDAIDWLKRNDFIAETPTVSPTKSNGRDHGSGAPRIIKTYDYVDEAGDLLFQVCRFEPKTFRQRRKATKSDPPDKVRDGWVWSVKGVRQVPYRYPEIAEAIALEHTIHLVEGEKDADALWALGVPATTNAMGAGKWPLSLADALVGADVVIVPDNDEAGEAHAATVAASLSEKATSVRVLRLPGLDPKGDVSDWLAAGGTVEAFLDLEARLARPWATTQAKLHFGSVWFEEAQTVMEDAEWLVDDLLTRGDMSLVYGASQSGKSFFATHLALAISRGTDVFGRKVTKGGVYYISAEGKKGFKKRLEAYRIRNSIDAGAPLPFVLVPAAVDLFAKEGDIDKLIADLMVIEPEMQRRGTQTELIVIDTYAAISPGANENASEDVSRVIKNLQRLRDVVPHAHIMIVHHKNAGGERPRGHTSLYAGIDNAIEVSCDDFKNRVAKVDKMKDGEDGIAIGFKLDTVTLGKRASDDKPITSCVVIPADMPDESLRGGFALTNAQKIALQALREALITNGEPAPSSLQLPYGIRIVRVEHWKREFLKRGFDESPTEDAFRMAFKRVGESLVAKAIIGRDQPFVWIVREPSN